MWILEALSETPFQRPFILLAATLGAAFLLLALFSASPVLEPIIYAIIAFDLYWLYKQPKSYYALLAAPICLVGAILLLPAYPWLLALLFSLAVGKLIFPKTFGMVRWLSCAGLLLVAIIATRFWEQLGLVNQLVPYGLAPLLHSTVFSFLLFFSFAAYTVKQNRVDTAYDSAVWESASEPATIAVHSKERYQLLRKQFAREKTGIRARQELEEFTEKLVRLCYQLQEMLRQIAHCDAVKLDREIMDLQAKTETTQDAVAQTQYRRALENKEKQKEQHQRMIVHSERLRAQVYNYSTALENLALAYSQQEATSESRGNEAIEFFLHLAEMRAENTYQSSEAYEHLASK